DEQSAEKGDSSFADRSSPATWTDKRIEEKLGQFVDRLVGKLGDVVDHRQAPSSPSPAPPPPPSKAPEPTAPPPALPTSAPRPAVVPTTTPKPLSHVPYPPRLLRKRKRLIGFSCVALALFLVLLLYQLLRPVKSPEGGNRPIPPEGLPTPGLIEKLNKAE